jgi:hypothetical protein
VNWNGQSLTVPFTGQFGAEQLRAGPLKDRLLQSSGQQVPSRSTYAFTMGGQPGTATPLGPPAANGQTLWQVKWNGVTLDVPLAGPFGPAQLRPGSYVKERLLALSGQQGSGSPGATSPMGQPSAGQASFSSDARARALSNLSTLERLTSELVQVRRTAPGHSRRSPSSQQRSANAPIDRLRTDLRALREDLEGGRISPEQFRARFSAANRAYGDLVRDRMHRQVSVARREAGFAETAATAAEVTRGAGLAAASFFGPQAAAAYSVGTQALMEASYSANG